MILIFVEGVDVGQNVAPCMDRHGVCSCGRQMETLHPISRPSSIISQQWSAWVKDTMSGGREGYPLPRTVCSGQLSMACIMVGVWG